MICLRCGYCCKTSLVVIVVDPKLGIREGNLKGINCLEEKCPHLRGDIPGQYSCAIHNEKWYKKTPCFSHRQIEQKNSNCRMGEFQLKLQKEKKNGQCRAKKS